jgi:hypothetical protein
MLKLYLRDQPREVSFERQDAPGTPLWDTVPAELQEHQVRHNRDGHRAFDPVWFFGNLMLAQSCSPFKCFDEPLSGKGLVRIR